MESLKSSRVDEILRRISDTAPTVPAAGSAAALTGAVAAALGCFVSRKSSQHAGNVRTSNLLQRLGDRFLRVQDACLDLMDRDVFAYTALVRAIHETGSGDSDPAAVKVKSAREDILDPPMKLAEHAVAMLRMGPLLMRYVHPPAITDAMVVLETAHGCFNSAILIAGENTAAIKDRNMRAACEKILENRRIQGDRLYHASRIGRQKKF